MTQAKGVGHSGQSRVAIEVLRVDEWWYHLALAKTRFDKQSNVGT